MSNLPWKRGSISLPVIRFVPVRNVYIPTKSRTRTNRSTGIRSRRNDKESGFIDFQLKAKERDLNKKLSEMQKLSKELKLRIGRKQEDEVKSEIKDLEKPVEDEDVDVLYTELFEEDITKTKHNLLPDSSKVNITLFDTPARGIQIPALLLERMKDSVKNIVSQEHQNWGLVIQELYNNEKGLQDLTKEEVVSFLKQIPLRKLDDEHVDQVEKLLTNANITYDEQIYDFLMKHYAENAQSTKVKLLFDDLMAKGLQPTQYSYGHLIKAYSRTKDLDRINLTLEKMYESGIEPSIVIYTNVLRLCVNLKSYKEAEDVFQMMKFRSLLTKPDILSYNIMIEKAYRNKDYYRANDLYQELLAEGLEPNVYTLSCLAKLCSKNKDHILQGWKFIIEINNRNLEPTLLTFEAMLRLAARDGDLELSRAMYLKIIEMQVSSGNYISTKESTLFLLMAYRDFKFDHKPQLLSFKEGTIIRRNTIGLVDFLGLNQNISMDPLLMKQREKYPPLLPLRNLVNSKQIIAESNAVFAHYLLSNPDGIVTPTVVTYLRIAVEHGDKDEFLRRYETFTYPNEEIYNKKIIIEDPEENITNNDSIKSQPPAIQFIEDKTIKLERDSQIYITLLSGGKRLKDLTICEKAWLERGEYRKTLTYQRIPEKIRNKLDHQFAYEMVLSLLDLDLVYDAVHVVKASQRQFPWIFYALKPLYQKLIELGDEKMADEISEICNFTINSQKKAYHI